MSDSERLLRFKENCSCSNGGNKVHIPDYIFCERILALLNHPDVDEFCMLDAYYYDFSTLPDSVRGQFFRDMYLIFAITNKGDFVAKWVERWDLDSDLEIKNGKVER